MFVKFSRKHKDTGELLTGKEALQYCIDCGIKAGEWITETKWKHSGCHPKTLNMKKHYCSSSLSLKNDIQVKNMYINLLNQ